MDNQWSIYPHIYNAYSIIYVVTWTTNGSNLHPGALWVSFIVPLYTEPSSVLTGSVSTRHVLITPIYYTPDVFVAKNGLSRPKGTRTNTCGFAKEAMTVRN